MLRPYVVYYKFKNPGDKKPGAVKQFRLYAETLEDARHMAARQANYPDIEVLSIKAA